MGSGCGFEGKGSANFGVLPPVGLQYSLGVKKQDAVSTSMT